MLVKIIGTQSTLLVETGVCEFRREEDGSAVASLGEGSERTDYHIEVKAYVLNSMGDTIDSYPPGRKDQR